MKAAEGQQSQSWNNGSTFPGLNREQPSSQYQENTAMNESPFPNRDSPGLAINPLPFDQEDMEPEQIEQGHLITSPVMMQAEGGRQVSGVPRKTWRRSGNRLVGFREPRQLYQWITLEAKNCHLQGINTPGLTTERGEWLEGIEGLKC
ncbi:regulator of chromosome condensation family protein [Striga asiatica]|uniref:Regulator of chromosome condensation family protein n=1 Tax=Striga asiatica TaxID=4170 RepID=A0A5A7Q4S8_STRAF|nr:regulator of chromosome condensation family protein [Striga asiatica]